MSDSWLNHSTEIRENALFLYRMYYIYAYIWSLHLSIFPCKSSDNFNHYGSCNTFTPAELGTGLTIVYTLSWILSELHYYCDWVSAQYNSNNINVLSHLVKLAD